MIRKGDLVRAKYNTQETAMVVEVVGDGWLTVRYVAGLGSFNIETSLVVAS